MKLTLTNFRCWQAASFDFATGHSTLLEGPSGKGKSSILEAILFALSGEGRRVTAQGEQRCVVVMELDGITITRTKGPTHVVVESEGHHYEGDTAQHVIDSVVGAIGYLRQGESKSMVAMTPQQRLVLFERLTFEELDMAQIKSQIADIIRVRHDEFVAANAQAEMADRLFQEAEPPIEVAFPDSGGQPKRVFAAETTDALSTAVAAVENSSAALEMLQRDQAECERDLHRVELAKQELQLIECDSPGELGVLQECKADIQRRLCGQRRAQQQRAEGEANGRALVQKRAEIAALAALAEPDEPGDALWPTLDKNNAEHRISRAQRKLRDIERKEALMAELASVPETTYDEEERDRLKAERREHASRLTCPACDAPVHLRQNKLCLSSGTLDMEAIDARLAQLQLDARAAEKRRSLQGQIDAIQQDVGKKGKLQKTSEELEQYVKANTAAAAERAEENRVKAERLRMVHKLGDEAEELARAIDVGGEKICGAEVSEADLAQVDLDLKLAVEWLQKQPRVEKLKRLLLTERRDRQGLEELQREVASERTKLGNARAEHARLSQVMVRLRAYKKYAVQFLVFKTKRNEYRKCSARAMRAQTRYEAAVTLKEKVKECTLLALASAISRLNEAANVYLEQFFEDEPMTACLVNYREDVKRNKKPEVHMEIDYKGMRCDASMLSGGERQRLQAAFELAMAEMRSSKMVLLDESTSNLDEHATQRILECVLDRWKGKTLVMVAHQISGGLFDTSLTV